MRMQAASQQRKQRLIRIFVQRTKQILARLRKREVKFNAESHEINRAIKYKSKISHEKEKLTQKLADKQTENLEKKQIWQQKTNIELDKFTKNKAMNETIEYRVKMRSEELLSKKDLIESLKRQVEQLKKKNEEQNHNLFNRKEDLEVLHTILKKLG